MTGRMFCAGVVLLVLALLQVPGAHGQGVLLGAIHTGQSTPFSVYFADGQSTSVIGIDYLPQCIVSGGSGLYVRLEKTDGSLRVAEHGPFTGLTQILWNTTAHPTLSTSYSGTYVCRTNTFTSLEVYQINVVQRLNVTLQPSALNVSDAGERYSVIAFVNGTSSSNSTWTSSVALTTQETSSSSFSFLSNDSGIPLGVPFTVSLTARYQPAIECNSSGVYTLAQSVIDNCNAAAMPSQATTTVTVQPPCPALNMTNATVNPVLSAPFGTITMVNCIANHGDPMPRSIECLAGGMWSDAEPECTLGATTTPAAATTAAANSSLVSSIPSSPDGNVPVTTVTATADTATVASSALDTGAIAGIAVGGAILMALIAGLIIYFAVKRDSVRKNVHDGHGSGDDDEIMLRNRGKSPEKSADGGVRAIDTKDLGNLPPTGQSDQDHSNLPPPPQESAEGEYDAIVRTEHGKVQLSGNDGQDTYDHITLPNSAAAARPPSPTVAITTMAFTSVTVESVETTNDRANMQPINPDVNYSFVDPTKKRRE